jgi:hypothetical protein
VPELLSAGVEPSPREGRVRLVGKVRYQAAGVGSEDYWLEVPAKYVDQLSITGSCWLAFLLPLGAALGERVRIPLPVDGALLANCARLMAVWKWWYPSVSIVPVEADAAAPAGPPGDRAGAFFSGGIDSFFTLLRGRATATPNERRPIQDLLTVHGFDVSLPKRSEFERMLARHQRVADELGLELIDVATNLRETRWSAADWGTMAHGAGLAGIGLALERRFGTVYIASGGGYRGQGLHPWGSHPVTDPLYSTANTAIVYDAIEYLRIEKIEAIAGSAAAHHALHVCWVMDDDENCGACKKCLRTMLVLDLLGVLSSFETFPRVPLLERVARTDWSHPTDTRELEDTRVLALARGRSDVVRAIDAGMTYTRLLGALAKPVGLARRAAQRLKRLAGLG